MLNAVPSNDPLHSLRLAQQFLDQNLLPQAIDLARGAIDRLPENADAHLLLGLALFRAGDLPAAADAFRKAVRLAPSSPAPPTNLGNVLLAMNNPLQAVHSFQQALRIAPDHPEALNGLGLSLVRLDKPDDSIAPLRRSAELLPHNPQVHTNLALALIAAGRHSEALPVLQHAIHIAPNDCSAHNNLGLMYLELRDFPNAAAAFERAIAIDPETLLFHANRFTSLLSSGHPQVAADSARAILRRHPDSLPFRSALLLSLHYIPTVSPQQLHQEHLLFGDAAAAHFTPLPPVAPDPLNGRPLRVGYVSPDFRTHSVAHFMEPILAHHDPARVLATCYACVPREDQTTARLRSLPIQWRNISPLSDTQAASLIREDRIDILVDLAGHTAGNRLSLFALKPAPIQVSYLGYPNITGLRTIDFRITDAISDPPPDPAVLPTTATERLVRLPHTFLCFQPPRDAPDVAPLPALTTGHITFGTFNILAKLNPPLLDLWATLLASLPAARLLLKNAAFISPSARDPVRAHFASRNIDPARIDFLHHSPAARDHLAAYSLIDIALDTSPYNGTTTTCDALWMGVPVITLPGQTHHSRVGASLLTAARLTYLIADTEDHFLRLAADLASDLPALAKTRARLRNYLAGTPLFDPKPFTQNLEQTYLTLMNQRFDDVTT